MPVHFIGYFQQNGAAYFNFSVIEILKLSVFKSQNFRFFQITNLMHNSFIFQQDICYTTLLNMFRAARCSSSGGPIVLQ